MASSSDNIVWIDMEMTGLDIEKDHILEIACVVTDKTLRIISEELNIVIHQTNAILNNMNEWCNKHHAASGLIAESRLSTVTIQEAEQSVLKVLRKYIPKGLCPLAGNTVYMDRLFLCKYMPLVDSYLHYRIIDVSSVNELFKRWCPKLVSNSFPAHKKSKHRALPDIKDSITELRYYRNHIFKI